jgi:hypothetical protein
MRRLSHILICLILFGTLAFAQPVNQSGGFKLGSEPDGFRGIKWGTLIFSVDDMTQVWADGDTRLYERRGDPLEIGSAKLHSVLYVFWQDKFMEARVVIPKYYGPDKNEMANFNAIKETCCEKFGDRGKPMFGKEQYSWHGDNSWIWLGFEDPGYLRLNVGSTELQEEKKTSEEKRTAQEETFRITKTKEAVGF